MTIISFMDISKSFSGTVVFGQVTGLIRRGDRIGVVGPNGAGKTTLCRVLAGLESPDTGEVHLAKGSSLHYLEQEPGGQTERTVLEEVTASCTRIHQLEARIALYQGRLDRGESLSEAELESYGELMNEYRRAEGYSLTSRAEKTLESLGLGRSHFGASVSTLSGGQRSRLALAKALTESPDLLFLDEPTNHLDLRGIEYLEKFLQETASTVVVISHDRSFLDAVTSRTVEILDGRVTLFNGNYSAFHEWSQAEAERAWRTRRNYERKVGQLEDFIRRNIYGQKSRQAKSRRKTLERMQPPPEAPRRIANPRWRIEVGQASGAEAIRARGIGKTWPGIPPLFENLDLVVLRGEKLAIIGDNGTGKTTLLQVLAGQLAPDTGTVDWGREVTVGCLPQQMERPGGALRVIDYMADKAPGMTLGQVRSYLARFLFFGERVEQSVGLLSEGEFRRLTLAGLIHSQANLLLLDEPTNHLDIYSREALQNALAGYEGTLVLITHDRALLGELAERILEFNAGDGASGSWDKIVEYQGDYSYYKSKRQAAEQALSQIPPGPASAGREGRKRSRSLSREGGPGLSKNELQRKRSQRQALEEKIAVLEEHKSGLEMALADPQTYRQEGRAADLAAGIESLRSELEQAYREWEGLVEYD